MSAPGSEWSNPIWHREKWRIYQNPILTQSAQFDWCFVHDDYDGAEDSRDSRYGHGRTVEECKAEIDEIEAIAEEEAEQERADNSQFGVGA
jgi:hypothetical protein